MSGFKNTTRTVSGHHHWDGGSIGGGTGGTINRLARGGSVDKIDENPGHAEVYPKEGNRIEGNSATQRKEAPTMELQEHGGKTPLTAGFKKGGPARHFHVHHHHHAKGGKITTQTKSYRSHEKKAEAFAEGGHVYDNTSPPAGGPDYARGGKTKKPVRKNAGGALYAPGGLVGRGGPMGAPSGLASLAARPRGLPVRPQLPMRKAMPMPGPAPTAMARGGSVGMRTVAKQEVAKHVHTPRPRGHGIR